jgi:hypothetical protein
VRPRDSDSELDPFAGSAPMPELELDLPAGTDARGRTLAPRDARGSAASARIDDPEGPPARAVQLAHYGPPPPFWMEIPYAFRVVRRNRELRAKIPGLHDMVKVAERELYTAMHELGRAVFDAREHPRAPALGTPLRIAMATRRLTAKHEAEVARLRAEAKEKIQQIESSIARSAAAVRPFAERASALRAEVVIHQQRFEAESKAIRDATQELEAMARSGVEDADRRVELEARRTLRRAEADAARNEIDARTPELTKAEARVIEHEKAAKKAAASIEQTNAELEKTVQRMQKDVAGEAEKFEHACIELANEAVEQGLDKVLAPAASKLARLRHSTKLGYEREIAMHELALTLHYPDRVRRGFVTLGLLVLALVGFVIYRAVT